MSYQQLTEYIRQNRIRGVGDETIKQNLINAGWLNEDIIRAFNYLQAQQSIDGRYSNQFSQSNKQNIVRIKEKNGLGFYLIFLILIISALGVYFYYSKIYLNNVNRADLKGNDGSIKNSLATTSPVLDNDLLEVKNKMEEIKNGYLKGDNALIFKNSTDATIASISAQKIDSISAFSVNNIKRLNQDMFAINVTLVYQGVPDIKNYVFIKQDGYWKYDLPSSLSYSSSLVSQFVVDEANNLPDLKIVDVKLSNSKPVVNDKNFYLTISIKNDGVKESDGAPLTVNLVGFDQSMVVNGGSNAKLQPGEIVNWVYYPYEKNQVYKISDKPGEKTLEVRLNDNNEIKESNYSNNRFNRTFQVYAR